MKILSVSSFIPRVPVTGALIADGRHSVSHWGVVRAYAQTDAGTTGYGYTGTHAHLPSVQLITRCVDIGLTPLHSLISVALGEQLYTTDAFGEFFRQRAIHWAQPDVARMAGVTEVLPVCYIAQAWRVTVAPHAADMSQVRVPRQPSRPGRPFASPALESYPTPLPAFSLREPTVDDGWARGSPKCGGIGATN